MYIQSFSRIHKRWHKQTQKPDLQGHETFSCFWGANTSSEQHKHFSSAVGIETTTSPSNPPSVLLLYMCRSFGEGKKERGCFSSWFHQKENKKWNKSFCSATVQVTSVRETRVQLTETTGMEWTRQPRPCRCQRCSRCAAEGFFLTLRRSQSYKEPSMWSVESDRYEW